MRYAHWIAFILSLVVSGHSVCAETISPKEYLQQQGVQQTVSWFLTCELGVGTRSNGSYFKWPSSTTLKITIADKPKHKAAVIQIVGHDINESSCVTFVGQATQAEIYGECRTIDEDGTFQILQTIKINRLTGEYYGTVSFDPSGPDSGVYET